MTCKVRTFSFSLVACGLSFYCTQDAWAYAPFTHSVIVDNAIFQSSLGGSTSALTDLGFTEVDDSNRLFPNPEGGDSIDGVNTGNADTEEFAVARVRI